MKKLFCLLPLFLVCFGCDIFSVREAEPPAVSRSNFEFPSTPQIAVTNLVNALKEQNIDNYITTLCDSSFTPRQFRFIPAGGSAVIYPGLAFGWDIRSERKYLQNLFAQTKSAEGVTLTLSNQLFASYGDSTLFSARYLLNAPRKNSDIIQQFSGEIRATFVLDSRLFWTICTWQDINTSDGQCWSDLKGQYY